MEAFGTAIASLALGFLAIIFRGYVLVKFWIWFIIPVFEVRPLRIIEALGLSIFVSFMWYSQTQDDDKKWYEKFLTIFVTIAVSWFLGWILSLFY